GYAGAALHGADRKARRPGRRRRPRLRADPGALDRLRPRRRAVILHTRTRRTPMAEPGDPNAPDDHDDLIGFASTAALQGRARTPAPTRPEPEPAAPQDGPEPGLFAASAAASVPIEPDPAPAPAGPTPQPQSEAPPVAAPAPAASIFEPSPEFTVRQRRREPAAIPG